MPEDRERVRRSRSEMQTSRCKKRIRKLVYYPSRGVLFSARYSAHPRDIPGERIVGEPLRTPGIETFHLMMSSLRLPPWHYTQTDAQSSLFALFLDSLN